VESFEDPITDTDGDAWLSVSDDLLWGFNHALSNRLAAIASITRILEYSDTGLDPLLAALSDEVVTLEGTLKLLRLLPRSTRSVAEPVLLNELIPEVLRLHGIRADASDLRVEVLHDEGLQPVWIDSARLAHALLIVLAVVTRTAVVRREGVITVHARSTTELATIVFAVPDDPPPALWTTFRAAEVERVRRLVADAGGEFVEGDGEDPRGSVMIRLPTLLAVRARER
jgi:hypothetical protein